MMLAGLLALLPQTTIPASPIVPDGSEAIVTLAADAPGPHVAGEPVPERIEDVAMRAAGPAEVIAFVRSSFRTMDRDRSGFIEQVEAPVAGVGIPAPAPDRRMQWFAGRRGQARWIAYSDIDRDGRVSEAEFVAWDSRHWRDHVPTNWAWRR